MNNAKLLENTFQNYLRSGLETGVAREMCSVLDQSGLHNESKALESYLEARDISPGRSGELYWNGRKCYSGPYLPAEARLDDIWFDVVELTPMILVPRIGYSSLNQASWLALHPVYRWQFKGFLGCMILGQVITQIPSAPDYLARERFEGEGNSEFITDVYQDEALAYTYWFDKHLSGHFDFLYARQVLNDEEFSLMVPPGLRLWDEAEYPGSEDYRLAFSSDTYTNAPQTWYQEFLLIEDYEYMNLPDDRVVYEEWERQDYIGLSTCVPMQAGLIKPFPTRETLFFEFLNAAPRLR